MGTQSLFSNQIKTNKKYTTYAEKVGAWKVVGENSLISEND